MKYLKDLYKTLSDINDIDIKKDELMNYLTYPFKKEKNYEKLKEIPNAIKRRINIYITKLMKEKEIKIISDGYNIHFLEDLDRRIKLIRGELNSIDINDTFLENIEDLYINEEDLNRDTTSNFRLYNLAGDLNKGFYNDIDTRIKMAEEEIKKLDE